MDFALRGVYGGITGLDNNDKNIGNSEIIRLKTITIMKMLSDHDAPDIIDYL